MKIKELLEAKHDEWDDEEEVVSDPEQDKIPHLVMQLKKAIDVDGNYPIVFKNGDKIRIPVIAIEIFIKKYSQLKPSDREEMQNIASKSKDDFIHVLKSFTRPAAPKSIY
jgi:hypothetical protein